MTKTAILSVLGILLLSIIPAFLYVGLKPVAGEHYRRQAALVTATEPSLVLYTKDVPHIFFHSLIVYPSEAMADPVRRTLFQNNMITVDEFKTALQRLYENNFILIDPRLLYAVDVYGHVYRPLLHVPKDKKPLVLSLDDVNYYESMKGDGLANKLVVDSGRVRTQVVAPDGSVHITDDGDVIPILDAFARAHPDFSFNGARGIIGITGYDGILGYRTQQPGPAGDAEREAVRPVVAALKQEGWLFASHSFTHDKAFLRGDISTTTLAVDIARWQSEVEPLVGPTNLYIGPYGQLFTPHDVRRQQLLQAGFTVLYGVGLDRYLKYFDTYMIQDRVDIDGYRLTHNESYLRSQLHI